MATNYSIAAFFGSNLAELLSEKIKPVYSDFDSRSFVQGIEKNCVGKSYTQRIELLASELRNHLPESFEHAVHIILQILGEENPNETGMFTHYYWVMPLGKFIEKYGLSYFELSMRVISEITKRNTGEYAIRPFIRKYPEESIKQMNEWARSDNFHLRRLASEGLRPKLPWASKLETFIEEPQPVFEILEILKEDPVKFVQKSVANHLTDYLKVNPDPTFELIRGWAESENKNTQWVLKRATRKFPEVMKA